MAYVCVCAHAHAHAFWYLKKIPEVFFTLNSFNPSAMQRVEMDLG